MTCVAVGFVLTVDDSPYRTTDHLNVINAGIGSDAGHAFLLGRRVQPFVGNTRVDRREEDGMIMRVWTPSGLPRVLATPFTTC